jgi:hypothetical protein
MGKDVGEARENTEVVEDILTGLLRRGAQELIRQAVEAELCELLPGTQDKPMSMDGRQ